MNKKTINIYFRIILMFLGILAFMVNCTKDSEVNYSIKSMQTNRPNYILEKIDYSKLIEDIEIQASLSLIEQNRLKYKHKSNYSKGTSQVSDDLSVLTEEINKVTVGDVISWSFSVENPVLKRSDFENFLVKKRHGKFSYFLISYKLNIDNDDYFFENVKLYQIPEEYLNLDSLNLTSRGDAFDWADLDSGGGNGDCEGVIYTETIPCNQGGVHTPKYCCQHFGGNHGCGNSAPCTYVCSGTSTVTYLDFSHCNQTYNPPSGPSNDLPDSGSSDTGVPTGGGTDDNSGDSTVTSPVTPLEDQDCPEGSGKIKDKDDNCVCPYGYKEDENNVCIIDDCNTSKKDLMKIFPNAKDSDMSILAKVINEKGKDFGINTKEKLQHFLAQAGHETGGFNTLNVTESTYWTTASKLAQTYSSFTMDSIQAKANDNLYYAPDYLRNSTKVANVAMCCKYGNGNVASGDGYKYRGRGIFQLTWKDNYTAFKTWYNNKYDPDIDPVRTPDIIASNDTLAILSGLWFYKTRVLDKLSIDSSTTVKAVTKPINSARKGLADRRLRFQKAKDSIDCI